MARKRSPFLRATRWALLLFVLSLATVAIECIWFLQLEASPYHVGTSIWIGDVELTYTQTYTKTWFSRVQVMSDKGLDLRTIPKEQFLSAAATKLPVTFGKTLLKDAESVPPPWLTWPPPFGPETTTAELSIWNEAAVGWPFRAIKVRDFRLFGGTVQRPRGVNKYAPHWPGLLLDTALAAFCWWLPFCVPLIVMKGKRIRRRRLGLCPTCAYDRRGLAADALCPECGSKP